ncbi:single-stranded DNA-binding protein [Serinicoccus sp. LYQ131]|uniref:single-stranded DNA-binding protein n=1 Tax=Serinicoccus sp. LYQ131 TaxID=3378797 RepID=UPI0038525912
MMNELTITVSGNLTREPDRRVGSASGRDFAVVPIAVNRRRFDKAQEVWVTADTVYVDLLCFGHTGATALSSFKKGDPVLAHGRLSLREWSTENSSGTTVCVDVDCIGHDVSLGVSRFTKGWVAYDPDRAQDYDPTPRGVGEGLDGDARTGPDIDADADGVVEDDEQADEVLARSA